MNGEEMNRNDRMTGCPGRPETKDPSLMETWNRAAKGDADAQFMMGWSYENGLGVEKSRTRCIAWYTLSRDGGNRKALLALGNIYWGARLGWFEQITEVLTRSCKEGDPRAMMYLGMIYDSGYGWEKDPVKALE